MRPAWLLVLAALCLVPAAAAQNPLPVDPTIAVAVELVPASVTVPLGGSGKVDVKVTVTLNNMVCQQEAQVAVSLVAKDVGAAVGGITGTMPANLAVPVAAGQFTPATQAGTGTGNATFVVAVAQGAPGDHAHAFDITVTGPAAVPAGCTAFSPNQPTASTATKQAAVRTGPAPPATTSTSPGSATGTTTTSTSEEAFFVPLPVQVALLAALGLARRRYA